MRIVFFKLYKTRKKAHFSSQYYKNLLTIFINISLLNYPMVKLIGRYQRLYGGSNTYLFYKTLIELNLIPHSKFNDNSIFELALAYCLYASSNYKNPCNESGNIFNYYLQSQAVLQVHGTYFGLPVRYSKYLRYFKYRTGSTFLKYFILQVLEALFYLKYFQWSQVQSNFHYFYCSPFSTYCKWSTQLKTTITVYVYGRLAKF